MARNKDDVRDLLRKGAAIGISLLSKKDTIEEIFQKFYDKNEKTFRFKGIKNSFKLFGRMMKAYFKGEYKDVSPWLFIHTVATAFYIIGDIDLISDKIPMLGIVDDVGVLMWMLNTYAREIEKFDMWEARRAVQDIQIA